MAVNNPLDPSYMAHYIRKNTRTVALWVAITDNSDLNEDHLTVIPKRMTHGSSGVAAAGLSGFVAHADLIPATIDQVPPAALTSIHSSNSNGFQSVARRSGRAASPSCGYQSLEALNSRLKGSICDQANRFDVYCGTN